MADEPDHLWEEFAAGQTPGGEPAPSDAGRFKPCFRHGQRSTGITCQRCDRPICGECMRPASVGFQCPVCVAEQHMDTPAVTNRLGKRQTGPARSGRGRQVLGVRLSGGPVTTSVALMVVLASVWLIDLVTGGLRGMGLASQVLAFWGPGVADGQVWRLVTGVLVAGSLWNVVMCILFLFVAGRGLEEQIGRWRMLAIMAISGLGAGATFMILSPRSMAPLAFTGIIGMLAATAAIKWKLGEDIRGDLVMLGIFVVINALFGLLGGGVVFAVAMIGSILAGGAAGLILASAPRVNRARFQVIGLVLLAAALVAVAFLPQLV